MEKAYYLFKKIKIFNLSDKSALLCVFKNDVLDKCICMVDKVTYYLETS